MTEQSKASLNNRKSRESYVEFQLTQHQFHTQRQQTTHALNTSTSLRQSSSTDLLSTLTIEFHINNPIRQILYQFKTMLNSKYHINHILHRAYKCIEIFQNQMYIIRMTLSDKIKKLFACTEPPRYLLHIRTHQYRSVRTVSIRPLQSSQTDIDTTIRNTPSSIIQAEQILRYLSSSRNLNKPLTNQQLNELDCEYKQDIYSLDATANYMFSRMLVDTNYSIGKRISQVVNQFRDNKKSIQQLKLAELLWMNKAIAQVTQEMLQGFNCSRKQLYQILGYCRKSIESYFYRSIEQNIIEIATQKQKQKLQQHIPEKDCTKSNTQQHLQKQSQLTSLYPVSIKHLKILTNVYISVEIYEQLFLFSEFLKIQTQNNQISQENKHEFLEWVKQRYSETILQKLRALRAAGFGDKCFQGFIKQLKLQQ